MYSNHDMCRDLFPGLPNYAFQENRHDQSVFSVILKKHLRNNSDDVFVITNKQISSRKSIQIHGKNIQSMEMKQLEELIKKHYFIDFIAK